MSIWTRSLAILLLLGVTSPGAVSAQQMERVKGKPMYTVLPFGAIPAIDNPEFVDAKTANRFMHPNEMVIGIVDGNEARAYSAWHLDRHEIVNDVLHGVPIAVTW